jgi:hypothetical protein
VVIRLCRPCLLLSSEFTKMFELFSSENFTRADVCSPLAFAETNTNGTSESCLSGTGPIAEHIGLFLRCSSRLKSPWTAWSVFARLKDTAIHQRVQDRELPNIAHIVHVCARVRPWEYEV